MSKNSSSKKSSTVHLETSTWKEIAEYQKETGISSRNDAIERMLIERRMLLLSLQDRNITPIQEDKDYSEDSPEFDILDTAIMNAADDMPDE